MAPRDDFVELYIDEAETNAGEWEERIEDERERHPSLGYVALIASAAKRAGYRVVGFYEDPNHEGGAWSVLLERK